MVVEGGTPKVLLLYASQTGNAQIIAESLSEQFGQAGITVQVNCCSQLEPTTALLQVSCLVFVASTTGQYKSPCLLRTTLPCRQSTRKAPVTVFALAVLALT